MKIKANLLLISVLLIVLVAVTSCASTQTTNTVSETTAQKNFSLGKINFIIYECNLNETPETPNRVAELLEKAVEYSYSDRRVYFTVYTNEGAVLEESDFAGLRAESVAKEEFGGAVVYKAAVLLEDVNADALMDLTANGSVKEIVCTVNTPSNNN